MKDVVCKSYFSPTFIEQDRIEDLQKYVEVLKQEKEQAQNLSSSAGSSLFSPSGNVRRVSTTILFPQIEEFAISSLGGKIPRRTNPPACFTSIKFFY